MQKKPYYSPEEIADYYAVSPETIRRMCREGQIPGAIQIGRQWRIPAEYVERNQTIHDTDTPKDTNE